MKNADIFLLAPSSPSHLLVCQPKAFRYKKFSSQPEQEGPERHQHHPADLKYTFAGNLTKQFCLPYHSIIHLRNGDALVCWFSDDQESSMASLT